MRALIDGDIVVYRAAFAAEKTMYTIVDKESGVPIAGPFPYAAEYKQWLADNEYVDVDTVDIERERVYEPLSHALANVKSIMSTCQEVGEPHTFLSQGACFRDSIATMLKYKGNRDKAPKPHWYKEVREFLIKNYGAVVFDSIEADDALAMAQTSDTVIVSIDKDLLQVPGYHYNWVREEKLDVSEDVGMRKLYQQVLTGDSTDNIPGIYRCGIKTARKIIAECETEKDMLQVTAAKWMEYLAGDLQKPTDMKYIQHKDKAGTYIPESGVVLYYSWKDTPCESTPEQIRDEVFNLVKVGGGYAEEAAHTSGEDVLIPRRA